MDTLLSQLNHLYDSENSEFNIKLDKIFYREILKEMLQQFNELGFNGKQKSQLQGLIQTLEKKIKNNAKEGK